MTNDGFAGEPSAQRFTSVLVRSALAVFVGLGLWNGATAGSLSVTSAAYDGIYGLSVMPTGCLAVPDLLLDSIPVSGSYLACQTLTARGVQVSSDTDFAAGASIELLPGEGEFKVDEGVVFQAIIDNSMSQFAWVEDDSPNAETRYNAEFYIDLNDIVLGGSDELDLLVGYSEGGLVQFRVTLKSAGLLVAARTDGSDLLSDAMSPIPVPSNDWFCINLTFRAGAGDGSVLISIDAGPPAGMVDLDNDQSQVDIVRLGAVDGILGQPGYIAFDLDSFSSWR